MNCAIAKAEPARYHTARGSLRISTGSGGASASAEPGATGLPQARLRAGSNLGGLMPKKADDWKVGLSARTVDEIEYIMQAFHGASHGEIVIKAARSADRTGIRRRFDYEDGVDYLYAEGRILIRDDYLVRALEVLEPPNQRNRVRTDLDRVRPVIAGVVRHTLGRQFPTVDAALEALERQFGPGIATPDHVMTVAPPRVTLPGHRSPGSVCRDRALSLGMPEQRRRRRPDLHRRHRAVERRRQDTPMAGRGSCWRYRPAARAPGWHPAHPAVHRARHVRRGRHAVHGARPQMS